MRVLAFALLSITPFSLAQSFSDSQINLVRSRLADAAQKSWELGTRAQALLELDTPSYSVFSSNSLPPSTDKAPSSMTPVLDIARDIVGNRSKSNDNAKGAQPLMQDGSAADPASNGVAVLLANWTNLGGQDYAGAATDQLNYLLYEVPRSSDGAISHRTSEAQLWSDFVYMVPPFLAYYGVLTANQSLVQMAYDQIKLYRGHLRDGSKDNLWKHIVLGSDSSTDEGHWSTGNGWAAAGSLRVLATIQRSQFADKMKHQQEDLANWVKEIHTGMYKHLDSSNLFTNYASESVNSSGNFYDAASTALLASTVYRLSALWGDHSHLPDAEKCRITLSSGSSSSSSSGTTSASAPASSSTSGSHITSEGWLTPVVNPHSFGEKGEQSAEGQAFVLELHAAWKDWVDAGSPGANGARRVIANSVIVSLPVLVSAVSLWLV